MICTKHLLCCSQNSSHAATHWVMTPSRQIHTRNSLILSAHHGLRVYKRSPWVTFPSSMPSPGTVGSSVSMFSTCARSSAFYRDKSCSMLALLMWSLQFVKICVSSVR